MTEEPIRPGPRLYVLDAFRGIVALCVVVYHITLRYPAFVQGYDTPDTPLFPGFAQFEAGVVPVLLFFLISGFVITWTIDRCCTPMDFVISRFSRIYPAYWASLLMTVIVLAAFPELGIHHTLAHIIINITMLQAYVMVPDVAGVYWSLAVELMFYGYALLLFSAGWWRYVHIAALAWVIVALGAVVLDHVGVSIPWRVIQILLLKYAAYLVSGMMLYQLWCKKRLGWSLVTLSLCIVTITVTSRPVAASMCVCAMGLIVLTCRGGLRWLEAPPLVWLGSVSYALYLVHEYPAYVVLGAANAAGLPRLLGIGVAVVVALLLAALISYGVERPAMRFIRLVWGKYQLTRSQTRKKLEVVILPRAC